MKTSKNTDPIQSLSPAENLIPLRKSHRKRWIFAAILLILIASVAISRTKAEKNNSVQYKTEEARRGDLMVLVTATGTLQPTNEVEVGSELSGIIKTVDVDYNDKVKIGQVLAKLDTTKLEAQVTQSKASLESAKAKVLQAQATLSETRSKLSQYQKVRELSGNKVPSQTEYDAAAAAYDRAVADEASAKAAVALAQANLDGNETDLSKAVIRSPINGIVLTREVEPGQTVAASFETPILFTLAEDLTRMELHVNVDEADIGQIQEGQNAAFTVDAYPDRTFKAQIIQTRYGAKTTDGVVTYETILEVNNDDLLLRPGMTATADIAVMKIENALLVSGSALRFQMPAEEPGKKNGGIMGSLLPHPPARETKQKENTRTGKEQQVWILKDGQPTPVSVTTGATDGIMNEILKGDIESGTPLIVDTIRKGK